MSASAVNCQSANDGEGNLNDRHSQESGLGRVARATRPTALMPASPGRGVREKVGKKS